MPTSADAKNTTSYWAHEKRDEDRAQAIETAVKSILDDQRYQRDMVIRWLRMYRNMAMVGVDPGSYNKNNAALGSPLSLNVVRSMCNTVHNHVGKNKPKASCRTTGASWQKRDEYKKVERWIEGQFRKEQVYQTGKRCLLDMIITGSYVLKVVPERKQKRAVFDRVFPLELLVDTIEGMHGQPRSMYQVKYIDRRVAARRFPDAEKQIMDSNLGSAGGEYEYLDLMKPDQATSDMVRIVEAYYEPSEPGAGDGLRTVEIAGVHVLTEEFKKPLSSVFRVGRWAWSPLGFWGMGLAEELAGIQLEINKLMRKVQVAMGLFGAPYVMCDRAANVQPGQVTNLPGTFIFYTGKRPDIMPVQTVHPEVFQQIDRLYQRAFEISGVNQFQAFGGKPAGVESGRAMLAFQDVGNDRLANAYEEYQDMHLAAAEMGIQAAKEIPGYKVKVYGDDDFTELDFKRDIDLEDDEYVLSIEATSKLADSVTGQIDFAERLIKMGLGGKPEDVIEHVAWNPDVAGYIKGVLAPKRLIQKQLSMMVADDGVFAPPEPHTNLALALDEAQKLYAAASMAEDKPVEGLERLRRYMMRCVDMIQAAQQPGAPQGVASPNMGAPEQAPQGQPNSASQVGAAMQGQ